MILFVPVLLISDVYLEPFQVCKFGPSSSSNTTREISFLVDRWRSQNIPFFFKACQIEVLAMEILGIKHSKRQRGGHYAWRALPWVWIPRPCNKNNTSSAEVCRNETQTQVNLDQACTISQRIGDNESHIFNQGVIFQREKLFISGSAILGVINLHVIQETWDIYKFRPSFQDDISSEYEDSCARTWNSPDCDEATRWSHPSDIVPTWEESRVHIGFAMYISDQRMYHRAWGYVLIQRSFWPWQGQHASTTINMQTV